LRIHSIPQKITNGIKTHDIKSSHPKIPKRDPNNQLYLSSQGFWIDIINKIYKAEQRMKIRFSV